MEFAGGDFDQAGLQLLEAADEQLSPDIVGGDGEPRRHPRANDYRLVVNQKRIAPYAKIGANASGTCQPVTSTARITVARIGERSAHTWFVLHELLGKDDVKNYDGSWTEWGNMVAVPVERGA